MKLKIKRNQEEKKGFLGGSKGFNFSLVCKVDLSDEENILIAKYKIEDYQIGSYISSNENVYPITVSNISRSGIKSVVRNVTALLELEDKIKASCKDLKTLLEIMASFGGEEVIEI